VELVADALRFSRTFGTSIEQHPLLVYYSALPFTPITSVVYKTFHNPQLDPAVCHGYSTSWPPLLLVMATRKSEVRSIAFSASGKRIVSGSNDGAIQVWDASTGTEVIAAFRSHKQPVVSVAISPDASCIVSSSHDRTIRIWDSTSGTEVLPALRGSVGPVAFSPDGTRIACGSWDRTILVIDVASGVAISPAFQGHTDWIHSVAFSPDGNLIISGSQDRTVRVWDVETGREIHPAIQNEASVHSVSFSPDGGRMIAGLQSGIILIWNIYRNVNAPLSLNGHEGAVMSVTFSPDGKRIASGSEDATVRVWTLNSRYGRRICSVLPGHDQMVSSVAFNSDGTRIASGSHDNTIRVWDVGYTVSEIRTFPFSPKISHLRLFSRSAASTSSGSSTSRDGGDLQTIFSPDRTRFARLLPNMTGIEVRDPLSDVIVILKLECPFGNILSVAFSSDGNYIISHLENVDSQIWNSVSGLELMCYNTKRRPQIIQKPATRVWDSTSGHQLMCLPIGTPPQASLQKPVLVIRNGWIVDISTKRAICKLPVWIDVASSKSRRTRVAESETRGILFGIVTRDGGNIVMAFPPTIISSPDTRRVAGESPPYGVITLGAGQLGQEPGPKKRVFGAQFNDNNKYKGNA
jgi:WD40 repeat protein